MADFSMLAAGQSEFAGINQIVENAGLVTRSYTDHVVIDGTTFTAGTWYEPQNIATALNDNAVVAAQDVSYTATRLNVAAGKTFAAGTISMSDNTVTGNNGGAIYNSGTTMVSAGTFTDNRTWGSGGAVYNIGTATVSDSVFATNVSSGDGGAICNGEPKSDVHDAILDVTGSTFTGNTAQWGGAIYNLVTATIRDSVFATQSDTVYSEGGTLTLGGTITTAANITSTNAITVETGTKLVLDLSVYTGIMQKELLANYDVMFGSSQSNLSITVNVSSDQKATRYVLATGAASFDKTVTVTADGAYLGTVGIGGSIDIGGESFVFDLKNGYLTFGVSHTGVVTLNGGTDTVVISGNTYTGTAYAAGDIQTALAGKEIVAAQDVSYTANRLQINLIQEFAADRISMSGNTTTESGGAILNSGMAIITGSTFADNAILAKFSNGDSIVDGGGAIYNRGTLFVKQDMFLNNTVAEGNEGGAIFNAGTAMIENCKFANNTSSEGSGVLRNIGMATITGSTFADNKAFYAGGAIDNTNGGILTISSCNFTGNTSTHSQGGAIYNGEQAIIANSIFNANYSFFAGGAICNGSKSELLTVTGCTFTGNAAGRYGGAIYNDSYSTLIVKNSVFATETDTVYNGGGTLTLGGTIWTAANITSSNAITVEKNTQLVLDLSVYAGMTSKELLTDYNAMFGTSQTDLTITINVGSDQAGGTYVLATGASTFDPSKTISVVSDGSGIGTFNLQGGTTSFVSGSRNYTLALTGDSKLTLTVEALPPIIAGLVTPKETDHVVINGTTYTAGTWYEPQNIATALNENAVVAAQDVSYTATQLNVATGKTFVGDKVSMSGNTSTGSGGAIYNVYSGNLTITGSTFTGNTATRNGGAIYNGGTATITGSTFSGNVAYLGGAIYNAGTTTIRDSIFATETDTVYNYGTLTLGGTIWTAANITSRKAITVEENTQLVLDLSVYAGMTSKELLTDYDVMFGTSQSNLSITVNIASDQTAVRYVLATGVSLFDKTITVTVDGVFHGTVDVGGSIEIGGESFVLNLKNGLLTFGVSHTGVVTKNGDTDTVVIGGVTYTGTKYAQSQITDALRGNDIVAAQGISYTDTRLEIGIGQEFAADAISMSGNTTTVNGGAICNNGMSTITGSTFAHNRIANDSDNDIFGGAIYNNGMISVADSTFTGNAAVGNFAFGGAIYNDNGTIIVTDSTFVGNAATGATATGGAIHSVGGTTTIKNTFFTDNSASVSGGAVYALEETVTIEKCSFRDNKTVYSGGAIDVSCGTAAVVDSVFIGNSAKTYGGAIYNVGDYGFVGILTVIGSTFTGNTAGNGGAIYNSGTATIRDSVFATETDTIYNDGTLTLGGTITTAANITSKYAVTVEENTHLVLDLSVYAGTTSKELLSNYDTMFGDSQNNLSITINVGSGQTRGTYVLATGASRFAKSITLVCGATTLGTFDCFTPGGTTSEIKYNGMTYTLDRNDANDLTLTVKNNAVYVNSDWTGLTPGATVTLSDGTSTAIFGTNAFATTKDAKDNANPDPLVLDGGSFSSIVFAGNEDKNHNVESRALRVDGGTFGSVFGGNGVQLSAAEMISYKADSDVEVNGGSIGTYLVAGDYVRGGIAGYRIGNNTLAVYGGEIKGLVVGGSFFNDFKFGGIQGNVSMTLAGGTFTNRIYGGNACVKHEYSGQTAIDGDISITLDASQNALYIGENIVCGSYGYGSIHGNVTLTVKGLGENLDFGATSTVSGGSGDGYYGYDSQGKRVYDNYVDDMSVAVFNGFSGDFGAKIVLFDKLSFEGESAVHFTNNASYFTEIGQWSFAGNARADFASEQKNDFKGDTLVIDTQGWDTSNPWTLLSGEETAFAGFDSFKEVSINGGAAGWDGSQWTCDGGLTLSLNDESGKKSMILAKA